MTKAFLLTVRPGMFWPSRSRRTVSLVSYYRQYPVRIGLNACPLAID